MAVLGALQLLKRKLTGSHTSKVYKRAWAFIGKAEARDKVGKIAQYGCRALQEGGMGEKDAPLGQGDAAHHGLWGGHLQRRGHGGPSTRDSGGRAAGKRLGRHCGNSLQATQRIFIILYLIQDHIYWLLKVGILKFRSYTPIQWHRRNLKFVLPSYVLNFIICWRNIKRLREGQLKSSGGEAARSIEDEVYENKRMMLRYTFTFVQIIHVSKIKDLDDWYIGLMGMVSSYIDAWKQW